MIATNIKYLRKFSGLNQTSFGKIFNCTRGMIDSYERGKAKPSTDFIMKLSVHYNLAIQILISKDLSINPGLIFSGLPVNKLKELATDDLLKSKDDLIKELRAQIKYLENQNEILIASISRVPKR